MIGTGIPIAKFTYIHDFITYTLEIHGLTIAMGRPSPEVTSLPEEVDIS